MQSQIINKYTYMLFSYNSTYQMYDTGEMSVPTTSLTLTFARNLIQTSVIL